ncbi:MAG TPA: hypothetical protein VM818_14850 [Vicinamibacterales bacterium]|nr:hypothetical protein [Vicinamibacterales bacterium]
MNRRSKSWVLATVCGIMLVVPLIQIISAQSYPKLLANGNGLALTRLLVEERLAGMWVASPSLRQGVDYRSTVRLTNYHPRTVNLNKTRFELFLNGAKFFPSDQYSGSGTPNRYASNADQDPLEPTTSKSYYVYFRWDNLNPVPMPLVTIGATIDGWEEIPLPNNPQAPVRPTS